MSANTNIELTLQAWSDIVEQRWIDKIVKLGIVQTGALENSFRHQVITDGAGNPERIEFAFNYYGRFIDMGVGRGHTSSIAAQVKIEKAKAGRRAKPWYSATLYAERQKLAQILAEKYGRKGTIAIVESLTNIK